MQEPPQGSLEPTSPAPAQDPPGAAAPGEHRRRRRILRITGASLAVLLVFGGIGGFLVYRQLNGNIRSAPLYAGTSTPSVAATPAADPFGRRALNILVIGSDSRALKANCDIGGACAGGIHADVELIVHVSADRSNATALSIPRDTMTNLPGCRDSATKKQIGAHYGQINSSLEYGPGCTVAAVTQLTGISIDHFVMADFSGVISMSDAVGGASVCVSGDVFDPDSHLKLAKGRHTVKGDAALQFVRTRHALGNGSDLGRTQSQHLFLGAVIRKLKSAGTLANPVKVYAVAQAATKALTVDTGLASIPKLAGLAATLQKVPTGQITFVTMPNQPDPADANRVLVAAPAKRLFTAIIGDHSLAETAEPAATPTAPGSPATASSPSTPGSASPSTPGSASPSAPGSASPSAPSSAAPSTPSSAAPSTAKTPSGRTKEALKAGNASSAADDSTCAQVSTQPIIYYDYRFVTPARAYTLSTDVPVSAK